MTNEDEGKSEMKGIYFEKGRLAGCSIIFPEGKEKSVSIGTYPDESLDILVENTDYFYILVGAAEDGYEVICDFDGPIRPVERGTVFDYGDFAIRLL